MTQFDLPTKAATPRLSVVLTGFPFALLIVNIAAHTVDTRLLDGVPVWAKPTKFALSFAVLFATIAWLETRLSVGWRDGWLLSITLWIMGTAMMAEMGYLMFQAGQAEAAHFNYSTPFHTFMYTVVMFGGALALVAGIGVYGFAAARDKGARLDPGLRSGVVWGFGLSFILTAIVASYMAGTPDPLVGSPSPDAPTVPFFGWSGEVGDMRPAHFLSLHAMQALPFFGWIMDRSAPKRASASVALGAVVYSVATLALFAQALVGQPMIAL